MFSGIRSSVLLSFPCDILGIRDLVKRNYRVADLWWRDFLHDVFGAIKAEKVLRTTYCWPARP